MPHDPTLRPFQAPCPLTQRQIEIVRLSLDGLTNEQAGAVLNVEATTIRSSLHSARAKLGLAGKSQGALFNTMLNRGWLRPPAAIPGTAGYSTWLRATQADLDWLPSPAQRCYLTAFARLLRRPLDAVAGAALDLAFRLMCWEGGCPIPLPSFNPQAVAERMDAMLLTIARGVLRPIPR